MAQRVFKVIGTGKSSGRKRQRSYVAEDEAGARVQADADGTAVLEVIDCGVDAPTEAQLAYAKSLGLEIPADVDKVEASRLIGNRAEGKPQATAGQLQLAREMGIEPPRFVNTEDLESIILSRLGPLEGVQWYLYLIIVSRGTKAARRELTGPTAEGLAVIARELVSDRQFMESLTRAGHLPFTGVEYNQGYAYKRAVFLLKGNLGKRAPSAPFSSADMAGSKTFTTFIDGQAESKRRGVIWAVVIVAVVI